MKLRKFNEFSIDEAFTNLEKELSNIGYSKKELTELNANIHSGNLGKFLHSTEKELTFGILKALYTDCISLHRKYNLKSGSVKAMLRIAPMLFSPFTLIASYLGAALGSTRAVNKIIKPVLEDPGHSYPEFLKKVIKVSMSIAEGELPMRDPVADALVVDDGLTSILKDTILESFIHNLALEMAREDPNTVVPDYYIENQLRKYLNENFDVKPPLDMKI